MIFLDIMFTKVVPNIKRKLNILLYTLYSVHKYKFLCSKNNYKKLKLIFLFNFFLNDCETSNFFLQNSSFLYYDRDILYIYFLDRF